MSPDKNKESKSVTDDQKAAMIDFLRSHDDLLKGKQSQTFTQAVAKQQWEELTEVLNSILGPIKDWKAWRKVSTLYRIYIIVVYYYILYI